MENFTKGDWAVMPIESDKEYIRIRGTVLGGKFKIANVSDLKDHHEDGKKWCEFDRAESIANAYLIAAAPEMYSMLKECIQIFGDDNDYMASEIESLLSKARG